MRTYLKLKEDKRYNPLIGNDLQNQKNINPKIDESVKNFPEKIDKLEQYFTNLLINHPE